MPLVLAAAFVAGYGFLFEFPKSWNAEVWKWAVVAAVVGGLLLTIAEASTKWVSWAVLILVVAVVAWIMTRRLGEHRWYYVGALEGAMALSFVSLRPATRRTELWLVGPLVMWLCGVAATIVIMPWVDINTGRMAMMVTGLAGFAVVAGIWRPVRGLANGAGNF